MADGIDPIRSMPSLRGAPALFIQNFNYHCPNGGVRVPTAMAVIHQSFAFLNPTTGFTPYHYGALLHAVIEFFFLIDQAQAEKALQVLVNGHLFKPEVNLFLRYPRAVEELPGCQFGYSVRLVQGL